MVSAEFSCNTYLSLHETTLIISGLWPMKIGKRLPPSLKYVGYILDRSWIAFLCLNSLHLGVCQTKTIYDKWGIGIDDLYVHGQEFSIAFTIVMLTILFLVDAKGIERLFAVVNNNLRPRSAPGLTYTTMEKCYKLSQTLSLLYVVFCVGGVFHHCTSPIWEGERRLPADTWYPFDELKSPQYEIIYFLQVMGTLQSGFVFSAVIILSFSIATLMCGQYDLLYCSIHNLVHTAMIRRGDKKCLEYLRRKQVDWKVANNDWIQYSYSEEYIEDLRQIDALGSDNAEVVQEVEQWRYWDDEILLLLNDCVAFHDNIVTIVRESEVRLRYILGANLIHFTLLLCLLVYALSRHLVFDNTLSHIVIYASLTYALNFLLCYPPHILIYQV